MRIIHSTVESSYVMEVLLVAWVTSAALLF